MRRDELDEILARAVRGDADALGALVESYGARVFGLLYRLTGKRDTAEELMQETFLRLVQTIERYEHVGKFESWLFRIAANLARDRARMAGRRGVAASLEQVGVREMLEDERREDPAIQIERADVGERLAQALAGLSAAEREIVVLRHYSDLSFREIAELLGVPLGTALARAHRALQRLRELLKADEDGR